MLKIKKFVCALLLGASSFLLTSDTQDSSSGLISCSQDSCCSATSKNLWQPHAFSNYASRELLILQGLDVDITDNKWINRFGFATEYMHSFGHNCAGLGAMPFWSGSNTMTIGNNDGRADIDGFQFGLGQIVTDENGVGSAITLSPTVQHVATEFLWYGMQHQDKPGFYAKLKVPLGAMMIQPSVYESLTVSNSEANANMPSPYPIPPIRFDTVTEALRGGLQNDVPLYSYGKLACCSETIIRLGDITAVAGVNFVAKEEGHIGVGAKFSCPTGNVPKAIYILEPIFGRAGHWGVGAELSAHYHHDFDDSHCDSHAISFWVQAEAMHLFSGRQPSWRSFDLKANGPGSKYLLLQQYSYDETTGPNYVYTTTGQVLPAINVTTLPVQSTFGIEGNFAVLLDYTRNSWNISLCGEFWGRSAENLVINNCRALQGRNQGFVDYDLNDYAVMGRQIAQNGGTTAWCEPLARINNSAPYQGATNNLPLLVKDASLPQNRIPADYDQALDIEGAAACKIFTGKALAELGYTWSNNCYIPHLSIFGGVELADKKSNWSNLWSVGLQGSLQF